MTQMNNKAQQFLINCSHGSDDIERATVAFILAVSSSKSAKTAVFVTSDAADLCVAGGADGLFAEGYEPIARLIEEFVNNGGQIWLCPVCASVRGIDATDLRPGVEIAGAARTMDFIANGARLLA